MAENAIAENKDTAMPALLLGETGSDAIKDRLRETIRATVETMLEEELAAFPGRLRPDHHAKGRQTGDPVKAHGAQRP